MNDESLNYRQSGDTSEILDKIERSLSNVQQSIVDIHGSVASKLDVQTRILNDINTAHPAQKQAQTKIGKFLKKITKIEVIAVIIAILQLIIAFPQLQVAYNSLVHNDTRDLNEAFTNFINHTDNLALVQIADSLVTPQIAEMRHIQNELFVNLKILSNSVSLKEVELNKSNTETNLTHVTNLLLRLIVVGNRCKRINLIERTIVERYYPVDLSEDIKDIEDFDKLSDIQQIFILYLQLDKFTKISDTEAKVNDRLTKCLLAMSNAKSLDDKIDAFYANMPLREYSEYLKLQDEVGTAFINALNQAQYCRAYNISLK